MVAEIRERRIAQHHVEPARVRAQVMDMASVMTGPIGVGEHTVRAERRAPVRLHSGSAFRRRPRPTAASRFVPADGSRTRSPGRTRAARTASAARWGGVEDLVQRDLHLTAPGLGQPQGRDSRQKSGDLRRCIFQTTDLGRQTPDLQDRRRLDRVIGVAPGPGPLGVGRAEGGGHDGGDQPAVERTRSRQMGRQRPGGGKDVGGRYLRRGRRTATGSRTWDQLRWPGAEGASLSVLQARPRPPFPRLSPGPASGHDNAAPARTGAACSRRIVVRRRRAPGRPRRPG